jgi:hypothetical protein
MILNKYYQKTQTETNADTDAAYFALFSVLLK